MKAGRLNRRVFIDASVEIQDAVTGALDPAWSTIAEVWAEISPVRGRELFRDGAIRADLDTTITIRYAAALSSLNAKHRVRHVVDGVTTIYNIVYPAQTLLEHREIVMMCKSGLNEG